MIDAGGGKPNGRPHRRSAAPGRPAPAPRGKISTPADTQALGAVLSQLFALKGYGQTRGDAQLAEAWKALAGEKIAARTAVLGVNRGVLQIGVASAAMLGELASFHKDRLVEELKAKYPGLKLRDIKFRLRGDLGRSDGGPGRGGAGK